MMEVGLSHNTLSNIQWTVLPQQHESITLSAKQAKELAHNKKGTSQ